MRFVIFGAGAVGSVIGGRLAQNRRVHGHDVVLVARPAHCAAIRDGGLEINDPAGTDVIEVEAVEHITELSLTDDDVVVLAMKTQDTQAAVDQLTPVAPPGIAVVCAQNGVENERIVARYFAHVYAMCVYLPATFMEPGVVDALGAPRNAMLDLGCYPSGTDDVAEAIAATCRASNLWSEAIADVMRWKYLKLMTNLVNPINALVDHTDSTADLLARARAELDACFAAAGIDRASEADDQVRRSGVMQLARVLNPSHPVHGSSTWQSLARGAATSEVDWLNGEVVLLGRLHGVPTPVNEMLCRVMRWALANQLPPRSLTAADLISRLST